MVKNNLLAALNLLVAGLFLWHNFGVPAFLYYLGASLLCWLLLCWNAVGEVLVIRMVFRARRMPANAEMAPAVMEYLARGIPSAYGSEKGFTVYYAQSRERFFVPVSRRRVVVSLALEDTLIQDGNAILKRGVPSGSYESGTLFSRRLLLLSLLGHAIMLFLMKAFAWLVAFVVKSFFVILVYLFSDADTRGIRGLWDSIALGVFLGKIVLVFGDFVNYLQDKLVEWLMRITKAYSFKSLKKDNEVSVKR